MAELPGTTWLDGFLTDVDAGRVRLHADDCGAYLHLDGEPPADVSKAAFLLEQGGIIWLPMRSTRYELTAEGERVHGVPALIAEAERLLA